MRVLLDYETDNGRRGLGDVLISTPVIEALAKKYGTRIDVVLRKEAQPLLHNNPYVRHVYGTANGLNYDLHLIMGWKLEQHDNPRNNQPRVDSMAELFGVHCNNKIPQLYYPKQQTIPNSIGISIESTNVVRSWQNDYLVQLIETEDKYDWHVFSMNNIDQLPGNTNKHFGRIDLPELIAMVGRLEKFVTIDSFFSHLTACFDIPTIVMYTEVPAEWRCCYYQKTIALQSQVKCSPCWERQHPNLKAEIEDCYNRQNNGKCIECVESFTPEAISKAINDYFV